MIRTSLRRAVVPGIAVLALALTGCGAGNESSDGGGDGGSSLSGEIAGGGASSQDSAQQAWRAAFQGENSGVTITYDPVGSTAGRSGFASGAYVFAGSDSYMSDEGELADAKEQCGADPIEVPAYVSPIAVIFNLDGVDSVNLDAKTIAEIFSGKVTSWNDPAIAALNDGVDLPDTKITPVHRSDDSGTTKNFTDYLKQAGEGSWTDEPSDTWPLQGGESAEGTSGVVAAVKAGNGTIGYADESQAGGLGQAAIKVGDEFNAPSAEGAAKALEASSPADIATDSMLAFDIDRTTTESGAYPLILTSYLLACPTYDDAGTADIVKSFLTYIVSSEGQQAAAEAAGSAPLPDSISQQATDALSVIAGK